MQPNQRLCLPLRAYIWCTEQKHASRNINILTYLLIPWSTVLLEKLIGLQLVKKFSAFYGDRRFITAFTSARHLSLSQSISPGPRLCLWIFRNKIRFNGEELSAPRPNPKLEDHPCRVSATAYSIYSQLPSILEAVPPSVTWGRAMSWWQRPTYHGIACYINV